MGTAPWCAVSRSETDTEGAFLGDGLKAARTGILLRSRCRVEGRVGRLGGADTRRGGKEPGPGAATTVSLRGPQGHS